MVVLALGLLLGLVADRVESACEVPMDWRLSRPDADGKATRVTVGVYLIDLQSIDDSAQFFQADILLSVTWQDPRLVSGAGVESLAGCRPGLDEVWNPRLILVNERDVRRLFDDGVSIAPDGTVGYVQRLQGEFTLALELRDFPFDRQEVLFEIVSRGYAPEEVELLSHVIGGEFGRLTITDWDVGEGYAVVEPRYIEPRDRYIAGISFRLPTQRRLGFYLLKTFLPLTLIVWMSWAVFWIQPGLLPPQIGVATSSVLTLIAFQFSLGYMLPRLSYLTRADRFLIGSTLLVFFAFGEAIWTSYLATHGREAQAVRIDRASRILSPACFVVVVLVSFLV